MINLGKYCILLAGFICSIYAADIDSSSIIFNDTKVHAYELNFYYSDWQDSLVYYKNLDEQYIPARLVYRISSTDSIVLDSIGVRYKGNSSYTFAAKSVKKPFKFSFDEYKDQTFYGFKKLNFSNGAKDPSLMREKISYDIIQKYMKAPRAAFATISIEGKLIGLYTQVEQVDKNFLKRNFQDKDGNLYKSSDDGATLLYKGSEAAKYSAEYELKTNEKTDDWKDLINLIEKLNDTADGKSTKAISDCLKLDNICRYLAFNMVFSNFDSYTGSGRNFYLYNDPTSKKFVLIPWDLNLAFGAFANTWNVVTMDVVSISNLAQRPLNKRVVENDSLRQVYLGYIRNMIETWASTDTIAKLAEKYKLLIDEYVQQDSNKLHTYNDFLKNIDSDVSVVDNMSRVTIPGLKSFSKNRNANLLTQLDQKIAVIFFKGKNTSALPVSIVKTSNNSLYFSYSLPQQVSDVKMDIIDINGRVIKTVREENIAAGIHDCIISSKDLRSGLYLLKITGGKHFKTATSFMVF